LEGSLSHEGSGRRKERAVKLEEIEGIGPTYAAKLAEHGLSTTEHLLEHGGTAAGRTSLADRSGVSGKLILEWVNHADLCRVDGVAGEYADLLEAAGVDTVVELGQRNAANLATALERTNEEKKLVRRVPTEAEVMRWVEEAKGLPRAVHH
jgi:predicted flap endonuclease-1-like 5' DNA nuclease